MLAPGSRAARAGSRRPSRTCSRRASARPRGAGRPRSARASRRAAGDSRPRSARAGARIRPFRALTVGCSIVWGMVCAFSLCPRRTLPPKVWEAVSPSELRFGACELLEAPGASSCERVASSRRARSDSASAAISCSRSRSSASTWCARSSSDVERLVALALEPARSRASRSSTRFAAASLTWLTRSVSTPSASRAKRSTARSSSRLKPARRLLARACGSPCRTAAPRASA